MEKAFCEYCRKEVEYKEQEEEIRAELKGEAFSYLGRNAACSECDNTIYVGEVNDYNLYLLYNEYRKRHNIISLEEIRMISKKYNIGKRPLSLLLGWGEQTFSRYCDGDMPTLQYSDVLQRICDNPLYYLEILETNKEKLKSRLTYEKSRQAALALHNKQKAGDTGKMNTVVRYLLCKCEDITPLALQKLLYYIQGFYYAFTDRFIFEEDCEAWVHGPVYKEIYSRYKEYKFDPICLYDSADGQRLSVSEKAVIDGVIKHLSCYSGKVLEAFTHLETPWLAARGDLPESEAASRKIDKKLLGDYFAAVKERNNMLNPSDIGLYSRKMFEQVFI